MLTLFSQTSVISRLLSNYILLNGIAFIMMILRLLKCMDFQKRMGIVTRTLVDAMPHLGHYFVLFSLFFMSFSVLGFLCFGNSVYDFSTVTRSMLTCLNIMLGDLGVYEELFMLPDNYIVTLWYVSYIFLINFILLNVLLVI